MAVVLASVAHGMAEEPQPPSQKPNVANSESAPAATPAKPQSGAVPAKEAPRHWSNGTPSSAGNREVSVFGIVGRGSRFIYVFDRSGSMSENQGRPLATAKAELLRSIQSLTSVQQFQVIFYNERPTVLNTDTRFAARFLYGDERGKRDAETFARGISAGGGSGHYEALLTAINLSPDVIFFLTDGGEPLLTEEEFARIHTRNERLGAKIHALEFGAGPNRERENFLKRLARENGGEYSYVNVAKLPQP